MHSVIRIDQVEKRGVSSIHPVAEPPGKVTTLPTPIYAPLKRDS
jgi:hypothetical protein